MDLIKETFLIAAMDGKEQHMGSFGNMKGEKAMSKIIPLLTGSWITFCTMVGDYDGAMAILAVYLLLVVLDPLNKKGYDRRKQSHPNKKSLQKEV